MEMNEQATADEKTLQVSLPGFDLINLYVSIREQYSPITNATYSVQGKFDHLCIDYKGSFLFSLCRHGRADQISTAAFIAWSVLSLRPATVIEIVSRHTPRRQVPLCISHTTHEPAARALWMRPFCLLIRLPKLIL
jgi:hypothetical protein